MNVSVIIPVQASELRDIEHTVRNILDQNYQDGEIEIIVVQYGSGSSDVVPESIPVACRDSRVRFLSVASPGPYSARNIAALKAQGNVFLFTEAGCIPDRQWIAAHVSKLTETGASVSVGHVAPALITKPVEMMLAYENMRDSWVFSCEHFPHYFGRPKNMAVMRTRFESHGPFAEVIRGADSKFVQHVARELSCAEVVLAPDAVVRQTSVRSLPTFLRDRFNHARALSIHQSAHAMPVSSAQRRELIRRTSVEKKYGVAATAALGLLLAAGILTFRLGGVAGSLHRKFG